MLEATVNLQCNAVPAPGKMGSFHISCKDVLCSSCSTGLAGYQSRVAGCSNSVPGRSRRSVVCSAQRQCQPPHPGPCGEPLNIFLKRVVRLGASWLHPNHRAQEGAWGESKLDSRLNLSKHSKVGGDHARLKEKMCRGKCALHRGQLL